MKERYKIRFNPKKLSSETIHKHQNFDALLSMHKQEQAVPRALNIRPLYYIIPPVAAGILFLILFQPGLFFNTPSGHQSVQQAYFASQPYVQPPMPAVEPPTHAVSLDVAKGGLLEFPSGSKLNVPQNAFVSQTGESINGEVQIIFKEMTDPVDFFLSGIPMTYDSAGTTYKFESAGMVEVTAEQNGKRVYLQKDKQLDVELVSQIDLPILEQLPKYNIYHLNESVRNWEYQSVDDLQIIEQTSLLDNISPDANPAQQLQELKEIKLALLESALEKEKQSKIRQKTELKAPVRPKRVDQSALVFDIDLTEKQESDLTGWTAKYRNALWQVSDKNAAVDKDLLSSTTWDELDIEPIKNDEFVLKLEKENKVMTLLVEPVLQSSAFQAAMEKYDLEYAAYKEQLDTQIAAQEEVLLQIEARYQKQKQETIAHFAKLERQAEEGNLSSLQSLRVKQKVVNKFVVNELGVWNCDRPFLPKEKTIRATFVNQENDVLTGVVAYMIDKSYNTISKIYIHDQCELSFDPDSESLLWIVNADQSISMFSAADFREIPEEAEQYTFALSDPPYSLNSSNDLRAVLSL